MIGSPEINKVLRKCLCPALRNSGFDQVGPRKAWGWHGNSVWVFEIRAVGKYFSDVTGWPPMSVCAWLGVFFTDRLTDFEIERDATGRLLPKETVCQERSHLICTVDQTRFTKNLHNPAERQRSDIWWFAPDGSNMEEAVLNIRQQFLEQGVLWYRRTSRTPLVNPGAALDRS